MRLRFITDLHIGSPVGVWPPGMVSHRGPSYVQNPAQAWLWKRLRMLAKRERPDLLFICGDIMDLAYRMDLDDLQRAAVKSLLLFGDVPKYLVEGTPFHERWYEGVVSSLPNVIGNKVHDVVEIVLEKKRVNVAHHPETGGGVIYKATNLGRSVMFAALASAAGKARMPDLIVRGHLHHYALYQDALSTHVQLPSLCLQDEYAKRKKFYGWKPDIGSVDILIKGGRILVEPFLFPYPV